MRCSWLGMRRSVGGSSRRAAREVVPVTERFIEDRYWVHLAVGALVRSYALKRIGWRKLDTSIWWPCKRVRDEGERAHDSRRATAPRGLDVQLTVRLQLSGLLFI